MTWEAIDNLIETLIVVYPNSYKNMTSKQRATLIEELYKTFKGVDDERVMAGFENYKKTVKTSWLSIPQLKELIGVKEHKHVDCPKCGGEGMKVWKDSDGNWWGKMCDCGAIRNKPTHKKAFTRQEMAEIKAEKEKALTKIQGLFAVRS